MSGRGAFSCVAVPEVAKAVSGCCVGCGETKRGGAVGCGGVTIELPNVEAAFGWMTEAAFVGAAGLTKGVAAPKTAGAGAGALVAFVSAWKISFCGSFT